MPVRIPGFTDNRERKSICGIFIRLMLFLICEKSGETAFLSLSLIQSVMIDATCAYDEGA
ncbi:MAG: hypothetical protein ACE3JK_07060 [Sporolactobacillus sp.]